MLRYIALDIACGCLLSQQHPTAHSETIHGELSQSISLHLGENSLQLLSASQTVASALISALSYRSPSIFSKYPNLLPRFLFACSDIDRSLQVLSPLQVLSLMLGCHSGLEC